MSRYAPPRTVLAGALLFIAFYSALLALGRHVPRVRLAPTSAPACAASTAFPGILDTYP